MLPDIYRETLARYWGFTSFRPMQEEIIESVISGTDVVGLLPTGDERPGDKTEDNEYQGNGYS